MRRQGDTITRARAAAATASFLAVLLAGCTGSPGPAATSTPPPVATTPSATPKPTPSPTPKPTPSPTSELPDVTIAPAKPAGLDGPPTEENAAAVAQYYMSLFPYMYATGDHAQWERMAGQNCGYCSGTLDDLRKKVAAGRHAEGGHFSFQDSGATTFDDETFFAWTLFVEHPSQAVNDAGELVEDFPDTTTIRAEVTLVWDGQGWTVDGVNPKPVAE